MTMSLHAAAHRLLLPLLLFTAVVSFCLRSTSADSNAELVNHLLSLQSQSRSGVVHLDDSLISRFLTSTKPPRPYSLLIFFDAKKFHNKPELRLKDMHRQFSIVAASFIANNLNKTAPSSAKLFFCDIDFEESQSSFSLFGVDFVPHISLVGPNVHDPKESDPLDRGPVSRMAESIADFIQWRTNLTVGPIHRPQILSKKQLALLTAALLITTPFFIKKLLAGQTLLHHRRVWLAGALVLYFFSVSGSMHNIIRKRPMFLRDQNDPSRLMFFYQGSGVQLGAEGLAVGFLYNVVGLLLASMTHLLLRAKNVYVQRFFMLSALFLSFWAVRKVIFLDNWKTGYRVHAFWPSSWKQATMFWI